MNKSKFDGFINRYNLGGEIESVMIKSDKKNLSVRMISDDKTLLGDVTVAEKDFPNGEFEDISRPFTKGEKTNQRAELYAIYKAIKIIIIYKFIM